MIGLPGDRAEGRIDPSLVVLLSLFLLLLAFFIMLTAISQQERARSEAAVGSLLRTFRSDSAEELREHTTAVVAGVFRARGTVEEALKASFDTELPVATFARGGTGDSLLVRAPVDRVFDAGTLDLRKAGRRLMDGVADALTRREPDLRYAVALSLGSGPVLPQGGDLGGVPELRRVALLAGALRRAGVPAERISVGLRPGDPGLLSFRFVPETQADEGGEPAEVLP